MINSTVSHELRNPLNSIVAQSLQNKVLFEKIERKLERLECQDEEIKEMKIIIKSLQKG